MEAWIIAAYCAGALALLAWHSRIGWKDAAWIAAWPLLVLAGLAYLLYRYARRVLGA